jgi:hypothetical protein
MPETTARKTTTKKAAAAPPKDDTTAPAAGISTRQMRELHALLRDHGITGDRGVHDYLSTALGRAVESRTELTTVEAAEIIAELEAAEVVSAPTPERLSQLRADFPPEAIGKLPRSTCRDCSQSQRKRCDEHSWVPNCPVCNGRHSSATMHIDYVGHADVTARLLAVDPGWTWRPFTLEEINGLHPSLRDGLWIWLTVCGVTRPGYGDTENGKGAKEAIGDALRNAAMRVGVALSLWAKGDRDWAHTAVQDTASTDAPMDPPAPRERQHDEPPAYYGPSTGELLEQIVSHADRAGTTLEAITAKWRDQHGGLGVEDLGTLPPQALAPLESAISEYLRANPPGELTGDRDV